METKVKSTSTTKTNVENATIKANESIFNSMLQNMNKEIFSSVKGQKQNNLYKKDVFSDCTSKDEIKHRRTKIRRILESFCKESQKTEKSKLKTVFTEFETFYKTVYLKNDYSVVSLCNSNTDDITKKSIESMINIFKAEKFI